MQIIQCLQEDQRSTKIAKLENKIKIAESLEINQSVDTKSNRSRSRVLIKIEVERERERERETYNVDGEGTR